jgi:hypothetical protein
MALPPLATIADLEDRLGRSLSTDETARAYALLQDASAKVRAYTGQQITQSTSTDRIRARNGVARLPQRPVTAVTAVADIAATSLDATWAGGEQLGLYFDGYVDVTYTHGYATVPDDIVTVVAGVAARSFSGYLAGPAVWQQPSAALTPDTIGAIIPAPAATAPAFTADDKAILDGYRRPVGVAWML